MSFLSLALWLIHQIFSVLALQPLSLLLHSATDSDSSGHWESPSCCHQLDVSLLAALPSPLASLIPCAPHTCTTKSDTLLLSSFYLSATLLPATLLLHCVEHPCTFDPMHHSHCFPPFSLTFVSQMVDSMMPPPSLLLSRPVSADHSCST